MQYEAKTPAEYMDQLAADWRRDKLTELREMILAQGAPLEEGIEYKMLRYGDADGAVFHLNAQKKYVSLYVGDAAKVDPDGTLLEGLNVGKGCIRFKKSVAIAETQIELSSPAPWKCGRRGKIFIVESGDWSNFLHSHAMDCERNWTNPCRRGKGLQTMKQWWLDQQIGRRLPGWAAKSLLLALTLFWSYWGAAEMYHEGWWGAWYNRAFYLIPPLIFITLTLIALRWPGAGAIIIALFGVFAGFFFDMLPGGVLIVLVGGLFWLEKRRLAQLSEGCGRTAVGGPVSPSSSPCSSSPASPLYYLPFVLTRVDDGDRGARLIAGNGVTLIWAPAGPGWNWKQPWGGYPSWDAIALYGVPPIGMEWQEKAWFRLHGRGRLAACNRGGYGGDQSLPLFERRRHHAAGRTAKYLAHAYRGRIRALVCAPWGKCRLPLARVSSPHKCSVRAAGQGNAALGAGPIPHLLLGGGGGRCAGGIFRQF
jgi:hypothetical protein